jgi:hypothetical protein
MIEMKLEIDNLNKDLIDYRLENEKNKEKI